MDFWPTNGLSHLPYLNKFVSFMRSMGVELISITKDKDDEDGEYEMVWDVEGSMHLVKRQWKDSRTRGRSILAGSFGADSIAPGVLPIMHSNSREELKLSENISEAPGEKSIYQMNAFQLIGMAYSLEHSSLFEDEVGITISTHKYDLDFAPPFQLQIFWIFDPS